MNVAVGSCLTKEKPAKKRLDGPQEKKPESAQWGVGRLAEVKNGDFSTGFQYSRRFLQCLEWICHVAQSVSHGNAVEAGGFEGELQAVELDPCAWGGFSSLGTVTGDFQHGMGEIASNDMGLRCGSKGFKDHVSGTAGEVENPLAGFRLHQGNQASFPSTVESGALKIVDEVIAAGDF